MQAGETCIKEKGLLIKAAPFLLYLIRFYFL
ncbi:hypothetical protein CLV24_114104 [Pontibacter ummariensis]|uniref:Uncharacterized protein n=1 Tax=Pontibacter ummariensis TaxID=1610492 RepID=A0A239HR44_9BACT|nr:hypothetical protein CLV24_114104 [Pontibacter ummariensis]SNS83393.1 hypothetical protein SAMN06296052_114104 [Pontibacter ummariensis]